MRLIDFIFNYAKVKIFIPNASIYFNINTSNKDKENIEFTLFDQKYFIKTDKNSEKELPLQIGNLINHVDLRKFGGVVF